MILKEKRRCFRCLRIGHNSRDCRSRIKCHKCSRSHHLAMCETKDTDTKKEQNKKPSDGASSTTHASTNASTNSSASVLLQTAIAEVKNASNEANKRARILFDSGSQLSYISPELRHILNLKTIEIKDVYIKTFGSIATKESLEKVRLQIKAVDGSIITIECFVKDICHPLTAQNTTTTARNFAHMRHLNLTISRA